VGSWVKEGHHFGVAVGLSSVQSLVASLRSNKGSAKEHSDFKNA